ncbi:MAG: dihydroneopterin aldolase, partial [Planctomycetota bacterium]|nr:dihydroneopterin aldolase [Planctomycetota bacterium]
LDLTAAEQSDVLGDTICYFGLWTLVDKLLTGRSFKLVEFLAGEIIRACFEAYPAMNAMTVEVQKPGALRAQSVAFAGVEITRSRVQA